MDVHLWGTPATRRRTQRYTRTSAHTRQFMLHFSLLRACDGASAVLSPSCVQAALHADGAVAVANVPGLASVRETALLSVARLCGEDADALERVLPDGTLPVLSLLNRARKERVQRHLDAKPELAAAAEAAKRYTGILEKQP